MPSDLERMPHLMGFLEQRGAILSNTHTPMIAHTADDSLSIYTGLYGDRHGQPLSNSYKGYNPDGTTDPAASFAYWTSPFADTAASPTAGHDSTPSMVYSDTVPASGPPDRQTPAPWVPFTRAGCDVGDFSTANMVLENAKVDLPTIFGTGSPEVAAVRQRPRLLQGRRDRRLHRRGRPLRPRLIVLRRCAGHEVRPDLPDALRGHRRPAHRARRLYRVPGPLRRPVRRSAARARAPRT